MTDNTPEALAVTQADRDLVFSLFRGYAKSNLEMAALRSIKEGRGDDAEAVQMIARHRHHSEGRTGEGEALVPINATPAMRQAGADQLFGAFNDDWGDDADAIWKAMIAAALSQSTAGEDGA